MDKPALRRRTLKGLFRKEIHALELRFDTPHALIAHDALESLLKKCSLSVRGSIMKKHAEYVEKSRSIRRKTVNPTAHGKGDVEDSVQGLIESLKAHKVFNAYFYGLKCLDKGTFENMRNRILEICAHDVDGLGHVLIFADTCLRLMSQTADGVQKDLLLNLVEYVSRKATFDLSERCHNDESMESLFTASLEKIGLLGHNTILARSLHLRRNQLEKENLEHAFAQLRRNIDNSESGMFASEVHNIKPREVSSDPLDSLPARIWSGDFQNVAQSIRGFLLEEKNVKRIWGAIAFAFSKIKTTQPHFFILTESAWYIGNLLGSRMMELAMLQAAKMATEASSNMGVETE